MREIQEFTLEELKHKFSPRALTGDTVVLNMGPQHPSTHGVLRLIVELDGEIVVNCVPDVGYLHTGIEKNVENKTYQKAEVMTDRMDYMYTIGNNLVYCLAVEKLAELKVPPRADGIRVILAELSRIQSHLLWLGTHAMDIGAMSVFLYCMREREMILNIFELISGQRMMTTYIRPGGLWRDVPASFEEAVRDFIKVLPGRIAQYEALLNKNRLWQDRTQGKGVIDTKTCLAWNVTGPVLRATGMAHDYRKANPYSGFEQYDFDVPTQTGGDVWSRYLVKVEEMRQSLRIVEQALDKLPYGPVRDSNAKYIPPRRSEIGVSMEALIHHFKLWTEGFTPPKGSVYTAIESPRGEQGVFLESDGTAKPYRVHFRTPTLPLLQALPLVAKGAFVADLVAIVGSFDVVMGDNDR
ncbi:MAG TPA: NADH dehydrogenase (quinone) subunit D [Anaerolineaceae bacterium]|nr:NADH dehydrogenase (quinone) subunit D [Anaerolineaceae bacterium]